MRLAKSFLDFPFVRLFESLLPDFILGFAFFTALAYAVLGKRMEHQRSAVAMSASLGLALSVGLVWWEHQRGWSIKNLGAIAIGFAVIMLAMIMFQAIRQTGGSWAGGGIAFGASLLVAWAIGFEGPIVAEMIQILSVVALTVGVLAFLLHSHGVTRPNGRFAAPASANAEVRDIRHDMSDLYEDRRVGTQLANRFDQLQKNFVNSSDRPSNTDDIMNQLRRILPAEGWLTERLAKLRARAHVFRQGHIHRIDEIHQVIKELAPASRKQAKRELAERYKELHLDKRLERLDKAVAENERRIKVLTQEAQVALARYDHPKLNELLASAGKLQMHNDKLLKTIERTENKLSHLAKQVEKEAREVAGK